MRLGSGLGFGGANTYDPASYAYFAAHSTKENNIRQYYIDQFIRRTEGRWNVGAD
jgi:hypothetical protein